MNADGSPSAGQQGANMSTEQFLIDASIELIKQHKPEAALTLVHLAKK